jgi:hypothetical protein
MVNQCLAIDGKRREFAGLYGLSERWNGVLDGARECVFGDLNRSLVANTRMDTRIHTHNEEQGPKIEDQSRKDT